LDQVGHCVQKGAKEFSMVLVFIAWLCVPVIRLDRVGVGQPGLEQKEWSGFDE
jgi:hypothetical protein